MKALAAFSQNGVQKGIGTQWLKQLKCDAVQLDFTQPIAFPRTLEFVHATSAKDFLVEFAGVVDAVDHDAMWSRMPAATLSIIFTNPPTPSEAASS